MRNIFFVSMSIISLSVSAMDNHQSNQLIVYGLSVKNISAMKEAELKDNKEKCERLGISWPENLKQVVEIRPRYYIQNKNDTYINCLIHTPRSINQAFIARQGKEHNKLELMRTLMTPQFPTYIPFDQQVKSNFDNKITSNWNICQTPLTVCFNWAENKSLIKQQIRNIQDQSVEKDKKVVVLTMGPCAKAWCITSLGLLSVLYVYSLI